VSKFAFFKLRCGMHLVSDAVHIQRLLVGTIASSRL